jgi:outer membrane immunogenic protein
VYTKAAPVLPYNWSGFYIGGEAGWQTSRIGLSSPGGLPGPPPTLTYSPRHNSLAAGGFEGYQRQFGALVLGIEGGYVSAFGDASLGTVPAVIIFFPGGTGTANAKLRDIWSAGGRIGWGLDNWMPYVTGGYANGRFEFDAQSNPLTEQAKTSNPAGYVGVGVDWAPMKNGWIVGLEYRHYAFSSSTVASNIFAGGLVVAKERVTIDPTTDSVMGRVSYKFGGF